MDEVDLSWAAGLFAADGCATLTKNKKNNIWHFVMVIVMLDERSIHRFYEVALDVAGPFRAKPNSYAHRYENQTKSMYRIQVTAGPAERLAEALLPYLDNSDKADQIRNKMLEAKEHNRALPDPIRHPHAKKNWTPKQVRKMRKRYLRGDRVVDIASDYGITTGMVYRIGKRLAYAYV